MTKVSELAADSVAATFGEGAVERVFSKPRIDFDGDEGLLVTVVLTKAGRARMDGDAILDARFALASRLFEAGEERRLRLDWATEEELAADIDDADD